VNHFGFLTRLNRMLYPHVGADQRPTFFEIDRTCPELHRVTAAYADIKTELAALLERGDEFPAYHDIDPAEASISNATPQKWSVFLLHMLGSNVPANEKLCPTTCATVAKIPGLVQAFFSILEPGKTVPIHSGPYYGYLRYHLGLSVPTDNPPVLRINDQQYCWREGEAVLFDDSWPHEVINQSSQPRAVLIVDILRPMPLFGTALNRLAVAVARRTYARQVLQRIDDFQTKQVISFFNTFSGASELSGRVRAGDGR
jgi:aspartate beta-hydroxylase/beta-hydroxylase